jgi:hypothetical protein
MRGERDFAAAAQRSAVDRGDHRLVERLDLIDQDGKRRLLHRLAEFGDVGAGEEGLARAGDDDCLDAVVALRFLDPGLQALAHGGAERVHRRIVRREDQDVALAAGGDGGSHFILQFRHFKAGIQCSAPNRSAS